MIKPGEGSRWLQGGNLPNLRCLVSQPGIELHHLNLPASSSAIDDLRVHLLSVQISPGVYFRRRVDGRHFNGWMPAGSSWIRPAGTIGSSTWDRTNEVLLLSLAAALWDDLLRRDGGSPAKLVPRFMEHDPFVTQAVHLMARSARAGAPFARLLQESLAVSLVAHLANRNAKGSASASGIGLTRWQLRRVLDFMQEHVRRDLSLADIAGEANLSERYFCTAFKRTMGKPPYRYLIELRIEHAKALLLSSPHLSITEVALTVGFNSSTHFTTTFRTVAGVTPTSFRAGSV